MVEELKKLTTRVAHVLPVSDDGGSTAEIVRVLGKLHMHLTSASFVFSFKLIGHVMWETAKNLLTENPVKPTVSIWFVCYTKDI